MVETFALVSNPYEHYYETRLKPIDQIILHVTAGLQDLNLIGEDHSAAGTNRYGATTKTVASWHCCTDSDSIDYALPDRYTAFHCRGYNSGTLGLEISNNDARWDNKPDAWIEATLRNAAIVCLRWEKKYDIPRRRLSKSQVDSGMRGYSYHMFLDPARRRDPGDTFPWNRFVEILEELEGDSDVQKPVTPVVTEFPEANRALTARIQTRLEVEADGYWGEGTDEVARRMRKACRAKLGYPSNVVVDFNEAAVQKVVDVEPDGIWGPKSQAALEAWLRGFQGVLGTDADGSWGPATEAAFDKVRSNNLNKF